MRSNERMWLPRLLIAVMLLWALNPSNPYAYYTLLRWVSFGVFGYLCVKAVGCDAVGWAWIFGITAGLYNPIFRVHLNRELWSLVNVATAALAIASAYAHYADRERLPMRN
jgi:hypothetical protein